MYVDKLLRGSKAVQTLGRLARIEAGKPPQQQQQQQEEEEEDVQQSLDSEGSAPAPVGRRNKEVKVVDFVNMAGSIQESFEEFAGMTQHRTGAAELLLPPPVPIRG